MSARAFRVFGAGITLITVVVLIWQQLHFKAAYFGGISSYEGGLAKVNWDDEIRGRLQYSLQFLTPAGIGLLVFAAGLFIEHLGIDSERGAAKAARLQAELERDAAE
ncbi:MAG: hypothetical protein WBD02_08540 [Acidimicrobiia bacterium]